MAAAPGLIFNVLWLFPEVLPVLSGEKREPETRGGELRHSDDQRYGQPLRVRVNPDPNPDPLSQSMETPTIHSLAARL